MPKKIRWNPKYFAAFLLLLAAEICIALFVRDAFVRPYLVDVLVVVLIYCFVRTLFPAHRRLPLGIFVFAAMVEVAQYFDFVTLLGLQNHTVLATVLGSTFDWADIGCYLCGCLLLELWQRRHA